MSTKHVILDSKVAAYINVKAVAAVRSETNQSKTRLSCLKNSLSATKRL